MADLFIKILNMSISAGWLILLVVLLRLIFRRMPKWIMVLLWGIVGLRLLLPVSLESRLSLIPSAETISVDESGANTRLQTGIDVIDRLAVSEETTQDKTEIHAGTGEVVSSNAGSNASDVSPTVADRKTSRDLFHILGMIWLAGVAVMLVYASFSFLRLKLRVRESIPADGTTKGRIRICDRIETPFILGTFLPVIYLPSGLGENEQDHVIAHEKAHLSRRDHLWKPLGYLLLTVYWFNPLIWAAYILLCRDIEMACDEKVIRGMEAAGRKAYATTLVSCSLHQREVMVCPLAFGEVGVKERVKGILSYKRPAFWVILLSVAACIVVGVLFLTNPAKDAEETDTEAKHASYEGVYYYIGNKKETFGSSVRLIDLLVGLNEDGSFLLSEHPDGSIVGSGKYTVDGDMITLNGKKQVGETEAKQVVYHFRLDGDKLIYVAEKSSGFDVTQVQDGEEFLKGKNPYDEYVERCYYYTRNGQTDDNGLPIWFLIDLMPDGGCIWSDSMFLSSMPDSVYTIEYTEAGDILTITSTSQGENGDVKDVNRFRMDGNSIYYIAEGSSNFHVKLEDGDEFDRGPDMGTEEARALEEDAITRAAGKAAEMKKAAEEEAAAARKAVEEAEQRLKEAEESEKIIKEHEVNGGISFSKVFDNDGILISARFNGVDVAIDYGSSKLYTREEMSLLIEQIYDDLSARAKDGLELYAIRFTSDEECSKSDELKMLNESGREKTGNPKLTYTEYIKFETDMKEPDDVQKSSEPGVKHTGWGWWFAREEGGEWVLADQGY